MAKKIFSALAALCVVSAVSAYAPAVGSESLFELSSSTGLTYASSTAGGGIRYVNPASISVNPALTAKEQRVGLNAAYTALLTNGEKTTFGSMFQTGILIPFKWAVLSGEIYGVFPNSSVLGFGNSMNLKCGLSKEITEHLDVGLGLNAGAQWGTVADWGVSANLGFVYDIPKLSFMKDFRYGVSILNLGKNFASNDELDFLSSYPGFCTVRLGAAALLFANDNVKFGASLDLSTPCFLNMIVDAGLHFSIKDMLTISMAEKINVKESVNGLNNYTPSIGMLFTFKFNTSNNYLAKHDWDESEMTVGAAGKNLYGNVTAISAEMDLRLGLQDETPPVINIWFDEENE